jgi:hypothetical protein
MDWKGFDGRLIDSVMGGEREDQLEDAKPLNRAGVAHKILNWPKISTSTSLFSHIARRSLKDAQCADSWLPARTRWMSSVASRRSPSALHRPTAVLFPRPNHHVLALSSCFATSSYSSATVQDVIIQQRKMGLPLGKHSLPYPPHLLRLKQRRIRPKQVERDPSKRAPLKHRTSKSRAEIIADAMKEELRRSETATKETRGKEWTDARLRTWNEHREYFEARLGRAELERREEALRFAARYCNEAARIGAPEAGRRAYARAQNLLLDKTPEEFDAIAKTYRESRAEFDEFNAKIAEDSNIQVLDKLYDIRTQLEALEEEMEPLEELYPEESASHELEKDEQFKELMELRRERDELYTRAKALKMAVQIASMKPHTLAESAATEILENIRSPPKGVWPEDAPIGQSADGFQIRKGKETKDIEGVTISQMEDAASPTERQILLETAGQSAGLFPYTFSDTAPQDIKDMDALASDIHATLSRKGPSAGGRHDDVPAALSRWMAAQTAASPRDGVAARDVFRYAAFRFAALARDARLARREFARFADAYERAHREALRKLHLWTYRLPLRAFDWSAADEALDVHIAGNDHAPVRPAAALELASAAGAEPAVRPGEPVVLYAAPEATGGMTAAAVAMGAGGAATGGASTWILAEGWSTLPLMASGMETVVVGFSAWVVWFAYCTRLRYVKRIVVEQKESAAGPVLHATVTGRGYLPFTTRRVQTLASELRIEHEYDEAPLAEPRRHRVPFARMNPLIRPFVSLRERFLGLFDSVFYYIGRRYLTHMWTEEGQSRKFSAWWLDRRGFYNQRLNCKFFLLRSRLRVLTRWGSVLQGCQGGPGAAGAAGGGGAQGGTGEGCGQGCVVWSWRVWSNAGCIGTGRSVGTVGFSVSTVSC